MFPLYWWDNSDTPFISSLFCCYFSEVTLDRLLQMSSLGDLDIQDNPLSDETQTALDKVEIINISTGVSDPKGRELEELEWWRGL